MTIDRRKRLAKCGIQRDSESLSIIKKTLDLLHGDVHKLLIAIHDLLDRRKTALGVSILLDEVFL